MKRINLAEEQLRHVIELREKGQSYLGIEKETGVTRRVAQKAYDEWRKQRSAHELQDVRREVALEEFRIHLQTLTEIAGALINRLQTLAGTPDTMDADDYLEKFWESYKMKAATPELDDKPSRLARQNRMRFNALVEHTRDDVRWSALEDWKTAWNKTGFILDDLRHIIEINLKETQNNVGSQAKDDGLLWIMWRAALEGDTSAESFHWDIRSDQVSNFMLIESTTGTRLVDGASQKDAERLRLACQQLVAEMNQTEVLTSLRGELGKMKTAADELDDDLDPLKLRPAIIRTRCELCPI